LYPEAFGVSNMSDETKREEKISDEMHELEDAKQDESRNKTQNFICQVFHLDWYIHLSFLSLYSWFEVKRRLL
jgi:hypothetical protein